MMQLILRNVFELIKTILYLSVLYAFGNLALAFSSTPFLDGYQRAASLFGLLFIAFGTGGIKPCVSAFGGDQFVLPQQEKQLQQFFSLFYFSINAGSLVSTFLTPYVLYNVSCFGSDSCYGFAFAIPAALMVVATVIFFSGKQFYVRKKPEENILVQVVKCMSHALINKFCGRGEKKQHWLDNAEDKYDKMLIEDTKRVLRVLMLFLPIPVFWALFDQQGSRWTFQAVNMDGSLGWLGSIKPEQMMILNPLLILSFIPLFEIVIYPMLAKLHLIRTPLQKMATGGLLTALAFVASGILELFLQDTYAVIPQNGFGQLRIYNGLNSRINLISNSSILNRSLDAFDALEIVNVDVNRFSELPFSIRADTNDSTAWTGKIAKIEDPNKVALSYLVKGYPITEIEVKLSPGYDDVNKSEGTQPKLRLLYSSSQDRNLTLTSSTLTEVIRLEKDGLSIPAKEMAVETYRIQIDGADFGDILLETGGVYTLMIVENDEDINIRLFTIQPPKSIHMLWQLPQYFIITAAEVMVSITGLGLSYSQAPASMKSVLAAAWLLTTSLGNLIVIVVAELRFHNQAVEFFIFAALMTLVIGVFILISMKYEYVDRKELEDNTTRM